MFLCRLPFLIALCSPFAAVAQETSWVYQCGNQTCESQMIASNPDTNEALASVVVSSKVGEPAIGLAVNLPLGIALEPGAQIVAGETIVNLPFKVCLPTGCTAFTDLTDETRSALEGVDGFQLRFFVQGQQAAKAVQLPTNGLSAVLDRLSK